MTEIVRTDPLAFARAPNGRCFLSLHTRWYTDKGGKLRPYFLCARGESPQVVDSKRPEAVVIVAIHTGEIPKIVMTEEFRVTIGRREIGFPAGLIDAKDFDEAGGDMEAAAKLAAIRELHEETGFDFTPIEVSPPNLYSSAGMTDESVCIVLGTCTGEASHEHQEASEDILVTPFSHAEMVAKMDDDEAAWGKVSWPFLWSFKHTGFPFIKG